LSESALRQTAALKGNYRKYHFKPIFS